MSKNDDLHGNAPDSSPVALLIVDMISDFAFDGGPELFAEAEPVAAVIEKLAARARRAGVPVVYVNDNFGKWRSDFRRLLAHSRAKSSRGRPIAERLAPKRADYFVLKAKHSGFYSTTKASDAESVEQGRRRCCSPTASG